MKKLTAILKDKRYRKNREPLREKEQRDKKMDCKKEKEYQ